MLTNPNTLGLFDENIAEIASIVHEIGGTLYYDGANLNAIMGHSRPGDMGFDIVHLNLHKSFSQPHGGGGPGAGPIAVSERIAPYPAGAADRARRVGKRRRPELRPRPRRSRLEVDRPPARVPGQLRRLRPLLCLHRQPRRRRPHRGIRDRRAQRELPAGEAAPGPLPASTCRSPSSARRCTSSSSPATPAKRELGVMSSTSPSACSTMASIRRRSTSRCWSTRR